MKTAAVMLLVIGFSTSFYSHEPVAKEDLKEFRKRIDDMKAAGDKGVQEFRLINNKLDTLCKSYEKL